MDKPAFEIRMPDGHVYKIFANGDTEGFAEDRNYIVFDRIGALVRQNYVQGMKDGADIAITAAKAALDALGEPAAEQKPEAA